MIMQLTGMPLVLSYVQHYYQRFEQFLTASSYTMT